MIAKSGFESLTACSQNQIPPLFLLKKLEIDLKTQVIVVIADTVANRNSVI